MYDIKILALIAALLLPVPGWTNGHVIVLDDIAKVDVLPGWRTAKGTHMAAIRIQLAPGWHTYWRAPGDAGIPPQFQWDTAQTYDDMVIHWPAPVVFDQGGTRSVGYQGQVIIPIELKARKGGQIALHGTMELGVCQDICLPMTVDLHADLSPTGKPDPLIRAGLAARPTSAAKAGVKSVTCRFDSIADGMRLTAQIDLPKGGQDETVIVELADRSVWVSAATAIRKGRKLTAIAELVPPNAKPFLLQRSDIRITVLGDGRAVDIRGCKAG